jgi:DNA-binding LytR/AlgR family response regulator
MRTIIIEDQPPAQRILKKYIKDIGTLDLLETFSNAIDAMEFMKTNEVDLIFLDIHLPKISGIDFLRAIPNPPAIILTTAFADYALQGYEFNVVDYLLKPFAFERFVKAVAKVPVKAKQPTATEKAEPKPVQKTMFIKSGYEHVKINLDDINYINSDADYTEVHVGKQKLLSSEPLRYWLDQLDNDQYIRIHKSYIVNIAKVEKVSGNQVYLAEGTVIPIGRAYKEGFVGKFLK